ncbi:MAG: DNA adenine methylase [Leptolyngbya sp. SIO4C1]|nr:DNA adenine methylase [Leptolyngbya sp. SIO4C1]
MRCPPSQVPRPFLKWAGGKRQLLPELLKYVPSCAPGRKYYEPFIGGGALLLTLLPQRAVIGDSNAELINCYQVVRDSLGELIEALRQHRNDADYFYQIRAWDRQADYALRTPVQRAARIIYLNKTCYNGLFRVNSKGQFNAPFGRYKRPNILDEAALSAVSNYLQRTEVDIFKADFADSVSTAAQGDFVYFDPPYDPVSETASFTSYDRSGFDRSQQQRLKEVVDELTARGAQVLVSNAYTDFIRDLYQGYPCLRVSATRAINSNALKRGKVDEILIMNYSARKR